MSYEFRPVRSLEDWRHLHDIRRAVLFTKERHSVPYDENHPDDRMRRNVPFLLLSDGRPIGVARLDLRGDTAIVRLVAVVQDEQRKGHGRELNAQLEAEARRRGVRILHVNAAPEAVGYYAKLGWLDAGWDPSELVGISENCVQMSKKL